MDIQLILNTAFVVVLGSIGVAVWRIGRNLRTSTPDPPLAAIEIVGVVPLQELIDDIKRELRKLRKDGGVGSDLALQEIEIELLVQRKTKEESEGKLEPSITIPIFDKSPSEPASACRGQKPA